MQHRYPRRPWRPRRNRRPLPPGPTRAQARQYVRRMRDLLQLGASIEVHRPVVDIERLGVLKTQIGALNEVLVNLEEDVA